MAIIFYSDSWFNLFPAPGGGAELLEAAKSSLVPFPVSTKREKEGSGN